jgi:hypothetical protein
MIIKDAEKYAFSFEYGNFHFGYARNVFGVYLSYKVTPYKNKTGLRVDVELANLYGCTYLKSHRSVKFNDVDWWHASWILDCIKNFFERIRLSDDKEECAKRVFNPTWEDQHLPNQLMYDSLYNPIGHALEQFFPLCTGLDSRYRYWLKKNDNESAEAM